MAGSRNLGPLGSNPAVQDLNDGTMIRRLSSPPGPIRVQTGEIPAVQKKLLVSPVLTRRRRKKDVENTLPVLRQGSGGQEVQKLQRQLNARLGAGAKLAVDGIFGPLTHQAVLQYQRGVAITADGSVGKETWYHLLKGDKVAVTQDSMAATQFSRSVSGVPGNSPTPALPTKVNFPAVQPSGVWEWSLEAKFAEALRRTAPKLPVRMRHEFEALLSLTNSAIMVDTLVVWAASHAFGVGEVIDVVLLVGGIFFLGMAVFDVAGELSDFLTITSTAADERDLDEAASYLARAIAVIGIAAFIALLAKLARGSAGKGAPLRDR